MNQCQSQTPSYHYYYLEERLEMLNQNLERAVERYNRLIYVKENSGPLESSRLEFICSKIKEAENHVQFEKYQIQETSNQLWLEKQLVKLSEEDPFSNLRTGKKD